MLSSELHITNEVPSCPTSESELPYMKRPACMKRPAAGALPPATKRPTMKRPASCMDSDTSADGSPEGAEGPGGDFDMMQTLTDTDGGDASLMPDSLKMLDVADWGLQMMSRAGF
jgi:hypothetical protein